MKSRLKPGFIVQKSQRKEMSQMSYHVQHTSCPKHTTLHNEMKHFKVSKRRLNRWGMWSSHQLTSLFSQTNT